MTEQNSVWLYRNGIADFRRAYSVKGDFQEKISIPVRRDQVGDLLASIDYFGNVKLIKPPSYSSEVAKTNLEIDSEDPLGSILEAFSGSQIRLSVKSLGIKKSTALGDGGSPVDSTPVVEGILVGVDSETKQLDNTCILKKYVGIYTKDGYRQYSVRDDIHSVDFVNDSDRAEFHKALARNYQKIKPESTFVDLILESTTGNHTQAVIQYALPVAAWNMSYRLKRDKAGRWTLDGHAVVHNSTDFDWNGFNVSVVTGEPTSFVHDLAEAKIPSRSKVNVTPDRAYSNISIEQDVKVGALGRSRVVRSDKSVFDSMGCSYSAISFDGGPEGAPAGLNSSGLESIGAAAVDHADASTVGDYLIMTAKNLADIPANHSALVPMFSEGLDEAERVFYYKPGNHPSHPFSAVKFRNTTGMPLVKGVVTVTIEGHNAGEAVLEDAKPGDVRMIAHSLESGIRVTKDAARVDRPISLVKIGEGVMYTEVRHVSEQEYTVKNKLDEEAVLLVEHLWNVESPEVEVVYNGESLASVEKLRNGSRFTVKVPAKATINLVVKEDHLEKSSTMLDQNEFVWAQRNGWFAGNEAFGRIITIQEEINRLNQEEREIEAQRKKHLESQSRANSFLPNAVGQNKDRWQQTIIDAEDAIQAIDAETLPKIKQNQKEAQGRFAAALKEIRAEWHLGNTRAKVVA